MFSNLLIQLIETHADRLSREVVDEIYTSPRMQAFHRIPRAEMEERTFKLFHNLGLWLSGGKERSIESEFFEFGRKRFRQGIPLSEIMCAIVTVKEHVVHYVLEHAGEGKGMMEQGEFLPVQLHNELELFARVSQFYDRAFYHLARGYEAEAGGR